MPNLRLSTATQNAEAAALQQLIDAGSSGGTISIYGGVQPSGANVVLTGQPLLVVLTFGVPSFGPASAGVITANPIPLASAVASGNAAWARIADSNGNTVFDCDVGVTTSFITLLTTQIVAGGPIQITSFVITAPSGA